MSGRVKGHAHLYDIVAIPTCKCGWKGTPTYIEKSQSPDGYHAVYTVRSSQYKQHLDIMRDPLLSVVQKELNKIIEEADEDSVQ